MKLRHRVALTVAASTTAALAAASTITVAVFVHAQERELDRSLFARARLEAQESVQLGGRRIDIEQGPSGSDNDLEQLVKFGAMYRPDGRLMDDTATFGAHAPSLESLGWSSGSPLPRDGFDLPYRGRTLRAVMVRVGSADDPSAPVLLLAAPRSDMESDARSLARVMAIVVALAAASSLLAGQWIGARMTRGIEGIAATARRIAAGELAARVDLTSVGPGEEPASLGVDLNAMVDRLAALIETERRFASHAAHELRSPLAALRGELELALRRPRTEEAYREAIAEALDDTDRLIQLAEDLLAFVRSSVAGSPRERVRLSQLCEQAVKGSLARADRSRTVDVRVEEDATIEGRPNDLSRMLRNLIDNAIAHAPDGTAVRVVARAPSADRAEVAVEDRGPGVPPEARERIFQPFFRAEGERARSGAGLGLAIAREIARAHGGDVVYEHEGDTTRFVARVAASAGGARAHRRTADVTASTPPPAARAPRPPR